MSLTHLQVRSIAHLSLRHICHMPTVRQSDILYVLDNAGDKPTIETTIEAILSHASARPTDVIDIRRATWRPALVAFVEDFRRLFEAVSSTAQDKVSAS